MTQRIKDLLDNAVAGLEPQDHDPLGTVMRRGRAARRRAAVASGLAVLAVAALLVPLAVRSRSRAVAPADAVHPAPTRVEQTVPSVPVESTGPPPVPRVRDGAVVAGSMTLPIPKGWRVVTNDPKAPCGMLDKTILIIVDKRGGCRNAEVEVMGTRSESAAGTYLSGFGTEDVLLAPTAPVTLSGGEPAWPSESLASERMAPGRKAAYYNPILLPWSRVDLVMRIDRDRAQEILDSVTTRPAAAGPLRLPASAKVADLTVPDAQDRITPAGHRQITEQALIRKALMLLRSQTDVVPHDQVCATPTQPTARLELGDGDTAMSVIFSLGADGCQEAVSARGGRVRIDDEAMRSLERLFGIER